MKMLPQVSRRRLCILFVLAMVFTGNTFGQSLKLPAEVRGDPGTFIRVAADTDGGQVRWYTPDAGLALFPVDLLRDSKTAIVIGSRGRYRLIAWTARGDTPSLPAETVVIIGDVPPGPTPPGPVPPGPTPPSPDPPSPAPIPTEGFRVLVLYESQQLGTLPAGQRNVLYGKSIRDYLNAKCVLGADGKTREWRIWDVDVDTSGETKVWQDAVKRKPSKDKLPWIIISDGKKGFEGPLPKTLEETMTLLKKYGGE